MRGKREAAPNKKSGKSRWVSGVGLISAAVVIAVAAVFACLVWQTQLLPVKLMSYLCAALGAVVLIVALFLLNHRNTVRYILGVILALGLTAALVMGGMAVQSTQLTNILLNMGMNESLVSTISGFTSDIFSLAWKSGIQILLFLAGLQTIPPQTYEAAKIEGATAWQSFWKITVPQLTPITLLILVYTMIDSFTDYANPYIVLLLETIRNINIGYASALAWVYFAVISIVLGAVFFLAREKKPVSEEVRR